MEMLKYSGIRKEFIRNLDVDFTERLSSKVII